MKRMRSSRRFRRAKREYVWTTVWAEDIPIVQGTNFDLASPIVLGSDWRRGVSPAVIEKGAVLVRVVGDIAFHANPADTAAFRTFLRQTCTWGLKREDQDVVEALDVTMNAFEEDWMHLEQCKLWGFRDPTATLATMGGRFEVARSFDIRVKRKLTSEDIVSLYVGASPGTAGLQTDVAWTGFFRSLIQLP